MFVQIGENNRNQHGDSLRSVFKSEALFHKVLTTLPPLTKKVCRLQDSLQIQITFCWHLTEHCFSPYL